MHIFGEEGRRPRLVSALCAFDEDSVGGGDRFGNLFVLRLDATRITLD